MNSVAEEIMSHFGEAESDADLAHYGIKRRSGRYPWGSGENPYQHSGDWLSRVEELKKSGMKETEIAKELGMTTTQLRAYKSIAGAERRQLLVARAKSLAADGLKPTEIGRQMGYNESTIRSFLNESSEKRMNAAKNTANQLKALVDKKGMIMIGAGDEKEFGNLSPEKFEQALTIAEADGYPIYTRGLSQVTNPGRQTIIRVLCPPGTEYKEIYKNSALSPVADYITYDNGETFKKAWEYPASMDSKRMKIVYKEDGGELKDGVVELRPGVADLSLNGAAYAQVRILVDGTHYIKGMAVYGDPADFPPGVDVIFNTNKKKSVPVFGTKDNSVLKPIKKDPDNPFGALLREHGGQTYYDDPNGEYAGENGQKQSLSLINKTRHEGDWGDWSKDLPAQFLSKQKEELAKRQLSLAVADSRAEFDEIMALTNPTLKKQLLDTFASECDSAAVHLNAASLPRQAYQVILPLTTIKDNEVYAPQYNDGETVALIRFPHGGTFEIPILKVNNKNQEGKRAITSTAADAVGISKATANRLSGADFDGDTVLVIPCNSEYSGVKVTNKDPSISRAFAELADFDTKQYKYDEVRTDKNGKDHYYRNGVEFKPMKDPQTGADSTQMQMGIASNLITDMTLKGATDEEIARATKHSMVVVDAAKHVLDYRQSERDNGIAELRQKYQGHIGDDGRYHEGASTLLSGANAKKDVLKRVGSPKINQKDKPWYDPTKPEGALVYKEVEETYTDKQGKTKTRMQESTRMAETTDARTLVSDAETSMELLYASYANAMKSLANEARLAITKTGRIKTDKEAKEKYAEERTRILAEVALAKANAPRERAAQLLANTEMDAKIQANPDMTSKEKKKARQVALTNARLKVGAKRHTIEITDREWEAIQSGAISENILTDLFKAMDPDKLRERATPKQRTELSEAKKSKINAMKSSGYTIAEISKALGVSTSTVNNYLK